ncbi:MAG: sulfatase-like hydrolase/transferase [Clostridia bacterium]|nr:sulfatase-like hydrolase/transferase [Clostridia bacterium]
MNKSVNFTYSYPKRFLISLPAIAALVLTVLLFGPLELMISNSSTFTFNPIQFLPLAALVSFCAILIGTALLAVFRGKLYNLLITLCLAATLCVYVQNTFMNFGLPELNGKEIEWGSMRKEIIINTVIWLILFAVPFVLLHFKAAWRTCIVLLPIMMCVMQLTGFISVVISSHGDQERNGYLGYDHFCEYAPKDNVLVFMLDTLDYRFLESVQQEDPMFFERLDGFTQYDNAISPFVFTRPGLNFILTGYDKTVFKEDLNDFLYHSWDDGDRHILKDLNEAGYTVDLYAAPNLALGEQYQSFKPYIANLEEKLPEPIFKKLAKSYLKLSAYRGTPLIIKQRFKYYTTSFERIYPKYSNYLTDQTLYDEQLSSMKMNSESKFFKFYEFNGSHAPYYMRSDGTIGSEKTDVISQTKGSFEILFRAFDRMKELGIYKDTAIIITADHGYCHDVRQPLDGPIRIGLLYKPAGSEGTPLQHTYVPVSTRNISPTILKAAGLDYSAYGTPLDEVPDDQSIVRKYTRNALNDKRLSGKVFLVYYYNVAYDASKMESWTLTHTEYIPREYGY